MPPQWGMTGISYAAAMAAILGASVSPPRYISSGCRTSMRSDVDPALRAHGHALAVPRRLG